MTKKFGVQSTGLIAPIIREGDNLAKIVTETVLNSGIKIEDKDVIGITESVVARAQGNYVTIDEAAEDIKKVLGNRTSIVLRYPIYSRNRFAMILKAFARAVEKTIYLIMPDIDDVGNKLHKHPFTNIDYDEYYKYIVEAEGKKCKIFNYDPQFSKYINRYHKNHPDEPYPPSVNCNFRDNMRQFSKYTLRDFCKDKCEWGLEGSNKASEEKLKLFPSRQYSENTVNEIAWNIYKETGKKVEVMVYGDGCFKDPVGGIWEFADPVTSPAYTHGLEGTPNELKLKNIADEKYANLNGKELENAIKADIQNKDNDLKGNMVSQGTTPRRYVDLLASLMDLTSGSGDKGTPIVYVKGYFNNYATETKNDSAVYDKVKELLNPVSEKL